MAVDENPIKVVPGHGGVFKVTCGEHTLYFQCPHHHDPMDDVPDHVYLQIADLEDSNLLDHSLRSASETGGTLVVTVDGDAVDLADLSDAAAMAKELGVNLVVRRNG